MGITDDVLGQFAPPFSVHGPCRPRLRLGKLEIPANARASLCVALHIVRKPRHPGRPSLGTLVGRRSAALPVGRRIGDGRPLARNVLGAAMTHSSTHHPFRVWSGARYARLGAAPNMKLYKPVKDVPRRFCSTGWGVPRLSERWMAMGEGLRALSRAKSDGQVCVSGSAAGRSSARRRPNDKG